MVCAWSPNAAGLATCCLGNVFKVAVLPYIGTLDACGLRYSSSHTRSNEDAIVVSGNLGN